MNWLTNYVRPKIKSMFTKRDMPENMWIKDPASGEMVFRKEVEDNQFVVPSSGFHLPISPALRLQHFFDNGAYEVLPNPTVPTDPLKFRDEKKYIDRLKAYRTKLEKEDNITAALGQIETLPIVAVVQDFAFMGGSLGLATGEAIIAAFEKAAELKRPLVFFVASGGARMQEGIFSLMQMPRTTIAVQLLKEAGQPYIVVLTNPTTGGVSASYAMLGDVHIAEPGAMIGFAGPRVIQQTIREKLPEGFQSAEYLLKHGMVDMVVPRYNLKETIARLLRLMLKQAA
ncbi:acetyl-CoA carboxylase, carboxyltransferase subunit beta [Bartonella sp. TP]|uniref:acetyl-CoA carboxylase, carboxyltransferase subunit beta n=1 Tax=Bartonella sp. TP TaxID=3057550 RepID=UPI0025AF3364|nr:acetyl-CoA carboxylase, carboxyltransferase subunit beta [Bartonella sp. TP]MDN5248995.1 acetyl-CoA carboxylase, carboxyltransferase subunit beta [Alphaproteobacteria bacterium]WJW80447.1 acetyl-CoA carboxylase, carboxyltransferase subunit beta [Bartonella sp. TP]